VTNGKCYINDDVKVFEQIIWGVEGLSMKSVIMMGSENDLKTLFNKFKGKTTIIGPKIPDGEIAIRYCELNNYDEIPRGVEDYQEPGKYRLMQGDFFRHGFDSPKGYLHPPALKIVRVEKGLEIKPYNYDPKEIVFFGIKPCDAAAIRVMDKTFTWNKDAYYNAQREKITIIVENCTKPGKTCFCATMGTGPRATENFDIAYTRINGKVLFEAGSVKGEEILMEIETLKPASNEVIAEFIKVMDEAYEKAKAQFTTTNLPEKLEINIANENLWKELSEKCLACGNCTMVCPTCFCFDIYDESHLDEYVDRVRYWDSCFTYKYAEVAGGHFRPEIWAMYRQWMLHKFSYWKKQFDVFGCVGCGRCITWCPAGIDIRENVKKASGGCK